MAIQELTSENFRRQAIECDVPALIDFWSPACGPCRRMLPALEDLAETSQGRYRVFKVNVEEQPQLAARYQISALPTVLVFRQGEAVHSLVGYKDKRALLGAVLDESSPQPAAR